MFLPSSILIGVKSVSSGQTENGLTEVLTSWCYVKDWCFVLHFFFFSESLTAWYFWRHSKKIAQEPCFLCLVLLWLIQCEFLPGFARLGIAAMVLREGQELCEECSAEAPLPRGFPEALAHSWSWLRFVRRNKSVVTLLDNIRKKKAGTLLLMIAMTRNHVSFVQLSIALCTHFNFRDLYRP